MTEWEMFYGILPAAHMCGSSKENLTEVPSSVFIDPKGRSLCSQQGGRVVSTPKSTAKLRKMTLPGECVRV